MSKPATDMRLQRVAEGFTEVIGRGNAHIITRNPATKKCAYDGQVGGGWHYNGDQETDTAWEQDAVAAYLKMVKAGYNLRARKLFNGGDLIQWTDPVSGQYVKFQPQNFQWIDGTTSSNSLISVAQAISAPTVTDDNLYWPAAFGAGRHFRYTASPTKLIKHLIIDSAANIPACPTWITNPWLELTFTLTPSSSVTMFVDGVAWNQATAKTTANAIEFRLPSGQVVWSMAAPLAYDSSEEGIPCNGQIKLYVNKKVKYAAIRFPKSWIDTAQFPIMLDPELDYQVGAGEDDAYSFGSTFDATSGYIYLGGISGSSVSTYIRFVGIDIPEGATIDDAYLSFFRAGNSGTPDACALYAEDVAAPNRVTSAEDGNGRTLTTASITINPPSSGDWWNTGSTITLVQELVDTYGAYSSGVMAFQARGIGAGWGAHRAYSYEGFSSIAPKLHIEYTEAAGGSPKTQVVWI